MKELFDRVAETKSVDGLKSLLKQYNNIEKTVLNFEKKYPRFTLTVRPEDVDDLKKSHEVIDANHIINLNSTYGFTTLEKLLLAILWKNGHINRVQPVLDGIVGEQKSTTEYGVILRQFGKSLADPTEPIIDQHVLRAYCEYGDLSDVKGRKKVPLGTAMKESDQELIDSYRKWLKKILASVPDVDRTEFLYRIDKILFAIGKELTAKQKKSTDVLR